IQNNPNYKFVKGDICDDKVVDKLIKDDIEAIVNFAASTHVDRSIVSPDEFIRTNVWGTYVLLEAAKKYNIRRYIQISTDEAYGSCDKGSFYETSPLNPNSPYAATKAAGDHLAHAYFVTYNFPVIITRSSNNFGFYQFPEKIIPLFITNALENKKLPLYGDGLNVRDWLFVMDNCEAIDLILHKGKVGETYNISSGNEKTNLELTRMILKRLGKPPELIEYVKDRPGHDRRYSLDSSKIKSLGWQPKHDFQKALDLTIEWYKKNINWWKKLKV
ncbi:MAG: dTDP-glucose 4,6-dehydratase, partial [Candidatus Omnitrophota bacterium]